MALFPFKIVRHILSTNPRACYLAVLNPISKDFKERSENQLLTSCINTAYVISTLFLGTIKTQKQMFQLRSFNPVDLKITLPSGKIWTLRIPCLFDEKMKRLSKGQSKDRELNTCLQQCAQPFKDFLIERIEEAISEEFNDVQFIHAIEHVLRSIDYDFNKDPIEFLRAEISKNILHINENKSGLYCIALAHSLENDHHMYFQHVFLIEQFYLKENDSIRYRLYQSWIDQATLLDDFSKRGYADKGQGTWNYDELNTFIQDIALCLSVKNRKTTNAVFEPFGYHRTDTKPNLYYRNNTLLGSSLRFFSSLINPKVSVEFLKKFQN